MKLLLTSLLAITFHVLSPHTSVSTSAQANDGIKNDTYCDYRRVCGPNANCELDKSPPCFCLNGFAPKSPVAYNSMDYSQGCVRDIALNCSSDVFFRYSVLREPSGTFSLLNQSLGGEGCEENCLRNCSCMAYTTGSGGCKLWSGILFDLRVINQGGEDLFVRMSHLEQQESGGGNHRGKRVGVIVGCTIAVISGMMILASCYMLRRRRTRLRALGDIRTSEMFSYIHEQNGDMELPSLELSRIAVATDNFSVNNKLGEGGFGVVYKGILDDGLQIAVKRLSRSSGQGLHEFKNEVKLIAKLQHRNLVKLIGCCIQGEEKLLIYEYMPNRSLDYFIFGQEPLSYLTKSNTREALGLA